MMEKYANHIGADPHIGGMSQADHPAIAKQQIKANCGNTIDDDPTEQGNEIGLVEQNGPCREKQKDQGAAADNEYFSGLFVHQLWAGKSPLGFHTRMAAIRI